MVFESDSFSLFQVICIISDTLLFWEPQVSLVLLFILGGKVISDTKYCGF